MSDYLQSLLKQLLNKQRWDGFVHLVYLDINKIIDLASINKTQICKKNWTRGVTLHWLLDWYYLGDDSSAIWQNPMLSLNLSYFVFIFRLIIYNIIIIIYYNNISSLYDWSSFGKGIDYSIKKKTNRI